MAWLTALLSAIFNSLGASINNWLAGQQAHADAVSLGSQTEATAQAVAGEKAAQAEVQAAVDAPKTVEGVEGELDAGKF